MAKLTVELPEERRRALKAVAARRGVTIAQFIDESLRLNGVRTDSEIEALMGRLRRGAAFSEKDALNRGVHLTREIRRG